MESVLLFIGGVLLLVAFVCCMVVIVKMFLNYRTGLSIGSFFGIFFFGIGYVLTLVFGWQNKDKWGLQVIMPIYTGALILGLVSFGAGYFLIPKMKDQQQRIHGSMEYSMQEELRRGLSDEVDFNFDN